MYATTALAILVPCLSDSALPEQSRVCGRPDCLAEDAAVSSLQLLQARADVVVGQEECGYLTNGAGDVMKMFNNNGKFHSRGNEFNRSIRQVMNEHPGVDGYCYFNQAALYITYAGEYDYPGSVAQGVLGLRGAGYRGLNSGELITYNWEGENVTTHNDIEHYLYDDLYGYSLGFLQNQGIDTQLMLNSDSTAWVDVSRQQCEKIQEKYQFTDADLIFNDLLDANLQILAKCHCAAGVPLAFPMRVPYVTLKAGYVSPSNCQTITKREFALHHYMKCMLGYKNSAGDMAYLHGRACLIEEGKRIGHLSECAWSPKGV
mmetsp:Transcript_32639/g.75869  ORF Transcript_32639/g.75869 Transcript_32639/m.75869 type:complete len:317 (+) Transcript_32639:62-1012(+)